MLESLKAKIDIKMAELIFAATFISGLFAHGFAFCNLLYSHDSLMIYSDDAGWEISLGRFMEPIYLLFRKQINAPFLIGCLSLCFIAGTVCVLVKMFDIKNKVLIVLLAGILAVNDTMICLIATFCTWEDMYTLALLLAAAAVYVVTKKPFGVNIKNIVLQVFLSGMLLSASMGLYQSYVSVYVTLACVYAIWLLMNETDIAEVFRTVGLQIAGAAAGAVMYIIGMELMVKITRIPLADTYNGISSVGDFEGISLPELIGNTYAYYVKDYFKTTQQISIGIINAVLLIAVIVFIFIKMEIKTSHKLLILCVMALIPFGANLIYFISKGYVHELMLFAFDMVYIIPMLCIMKKDAVRRPSAGNKGRILVRIAEVMIAVIIMCNIVLANQVYLKKKLVYDSTQAALTRILYSIESLEGYEPGVTPVLMVGSLQSNEYCSNIDHFDMAESVSFVDSDVAVTYGATYKLWFKYVLNARMEYASGTEADEIAASKEVENMTAFPKNGYTRMVDKIAVVKLSE